MTQRCPKCHHVREPDARAPDWQCPACGVAYAKAYAKASGQASSSSSSGARMPAQMRQGTGAARGEASFWDSWLFKALFAGLIVMVWLGARQWQDAPQRARPGAVQADIEIYTTSFCETCHVAKAYMKRQGIDYVEWDVEHDIDRRREFYARGGQGTPLIFVHGQVMHGFDAQRFEQLRASGRRS